MKKKMNLSVGNYVDAMFNCYYTESGAYAAGIIDKKTAVDNFSKNGESILYEMSRYLKLFNLSGDHLDTVRAMMNTLTRAIEQLP